MNLEIYDRLHLVDKEKTKSVVLGPQIPQKPKKSLKHLFIIRSARPRVKKTVQNPDQYFHDNICKKFNVKGKLKKGIDMKKLYNCKDPTEKRLLTKQMTGYQKRK